MTRCDYISAFSTGSAQPVSFPQMQFTPARKNISERQIMWLASVHNRLAELVTLDDGWDGYSGVPVRPEIAIFALQMIEAICDVNTPAPQIVPGSSGDLQIEWHTLNGDIELHVVRPNEVQAWYSIATDNNDGIELDLKNDFKTVAAWVKEVTESEIAAEPAAA